MTNDNIRNLLERFMEGETSLEEEQRIARWFNDHPQVDADLENYRLMFAYFDEGMPRKTANKNRHAKWYVALAAAASLALIIGMVWPSAEPGNPWLADNQQPTIVDTLATPANTKAKPKAKRKTADTLRIKEETEKNVKRYRRHYFSPAPPKVLLAEAKPSDLASPISWPKVQPAQVHIAKETPTTVDIGLESLSDIDDHLVAEALKQLKRSQEELFEEALDSLNTQMQLAGLTESDEETEEIY